MTLDEAIKKLINEAEQQDKWADNYVRMDYYSEATPPRERRQRAIECRQLAEWLKELKELSLQIAAPRLDSIEEYHYELARCKAAFWSCNKRCMVAEEQYRRKADELKKLRSR